MARVSARGWWIGTVVVILATVAAIIGFGAYLIVANAQLQETIGRFQQQDTVQQDFISSQQKDIQKLREQLQDLGERPVVSAPSTPPEVRTPDSGSQGPQGAQGPKGDPGNDGPIGLPGVRGQDGTVGPPGYNGADGANGATGAQGAQGSIGPEGLSGPAGPQGATGPQGPAGADGAPGGVGPAGPACPDGYAQQTETLITVEHPEGIVTSLCAAQ